ncbi:MAG: hypothetical protein IJE46_00130 [Clostridia bacterium]|nr:hypothetical protein [Clostridia bacterium]
MIANKRIIALVLSVVAICSLAGCGNKEDTKTEQPNNEVVSQETETVESKTESSIYGTWVVDKYEVYDGPMRVFMLETFEKYYYQGAEWEFTKDNKIVCCEDKTLSTPFKIISDTELEIISVSDGKTERQEYELNGDTLIQYGMYSGDFSKYGRANAIYYKRK